jgi:hypothetical protein
MRFPFPLTFLVAAVGACQPTSAQIGFVHEHITVTIAGGSCSVDADYYFKNSAPRPSGCSIFYPLIHRSDLPYPDSILVLADSAETPIGFERTTEGIVFFLDLTPEETKRIHVRYRQRTPVRKFEYILTSTKAWGKPLQLAEFQIVVPDSLKLISCSPGFDRKETIKNTAYYHIKRSNFMPDSNLIVKWKRGKP